MVKSELRKKQKIEEEIKRFESLMIAKHNIQVKIYTRSLNADVNVILLPELKDLCIKAMHELYPETIKIKTLRSKSRIHHFVVVRQIFSQIAYRKGYTCQAIGAFLKKDHSTITYSKQKVDDYLHVGDVEYTKVFNAIQKLLKNVGTISEDNSGGNNSKSIDASLWDEGENSSEKY